MPHLSGRVGMLTEHGEAFADVGDVGVGVRLVGVAEDGSGLSGQGGGEEAVAEVGLGAAAGSEVVRGAFDSDSDPPRLVRGEQLGGHLATQLPLLRVRGVVAGLGQRTARRTPVHVDVLHADQPGALGFGSGQHPGLQCRKLLHPTLIRRVQRLIHHPGAAGDLDGELRVGGVATHHLNLLRYSGGARAVDHPHSLPAAEQGIEGGKADRAGTKNDMTDSAVHALSFSLAPAASASTVALEARTGSSTFSSTPERTEKVTAPTAFWMFIVRLRVRCFGTTL